MLSILCIWVYSKVVKQNKFHNITFSSNTYVIPDYILFSAQFTMSQRGKKQLVYNGYKYCLQLSNKSKDRWVCSTNATKGCRACIHTINDIIVKISNSHNHPSDRPPRLLDIAIISRNR